MCGMLLICKVQLPGGSIWIELKELHGGFYLKTFVGPTPAPRSPVVGGTWPRRFSAMVMLHGTLQRAPRPWIGDWRCASVTGIVLLSRCTRGLLGSARAEPMCAWPLSRGGAHGYTHIGNGDHATARRGQGNGDAQSDREIPLAMGGGASGKNCRAVGNRREGLYAPVPTIPVGAAEADVGTGSS